MEKARGELPRNSASGAGAYRHLEGEELRRFQRCLLGMASDVIELCERENIGYALGGGTALGAVRCGGFIPWDDDLDINIDANDCARFRERFLQAHGDRYLIHDVDTPGYSKPMIRVCRKGSVYRDSNTGSVEGLIFIELFRMENVFDNQILRWLHGLLCLAVGYLYCCRRTFENRREYLRTAREESGSLAKLALRCVIGFATLPLSLDAWRRLTWRCYGLCKDRNSKYVAFPSGRKHYFGEIHLREDLANTVRFPFEGHSWRVARNYDLYLRRLYGPDYMTPPPERKREHHNYCELKFPDED